MHGKNKEKMLRRRIRHFGMRALVAVSLIAAISVSTIAKVTANTVSAMVVDGENTYSFVMRSTETEDIVKEAQDRGMQPLGPLDVYEKVGNTTTVNVLRGVNLTLCETGEVKEMVAYKGDTVSEALHDNNIVVKEKDEVTPSRDTIITEDVTVTLIRFNEVTVEADGKTNEVSMAGGTVGKALEAAGVTMAEDDTVNFPRETYLYDGMKIKVSRVISIKLTADGKTSSHKISANSVEQALEKLGVTLSETDTVEPALKSTLANGAQIIVRRVTLKETVETEEIPFETTEQTSADMYTDESKVSQEGVKGEKEIKYKVTLTDGAETGKEKLSETITKEPVTKVILKGTKQRPVTQDYSSAGSSVAASSGGELSYTKMVTGRSTAYCDQGTTASGHQAGYDYVAVDPSIIPYGTRLYVRTTDGAYTRYCVASDTGGNLLNGNVLLDLWFPTEQECLSFGVRTVEVYFIG